MMCNAMVMDEIVTNDESSLILAFYWSPLITWLIHLVYILILLMIIN